MFITEVKTGNKIEVDILPLLVKDFGNIGEEKYFLDWSTEKGFDVYKLVIPGKKEILGLMSLIYKDGEATIEIHLLCVSRNNKGNKKLYTRIAGSLLAFAGKKAIVKYDKFPCVSLKTKDNISKNYIDAYGVVPFGTMLALEGINLIRLIEEYDKEEE